jgi:hypothetical protein
MLKTLDILIGATTVLLLFSMAVTVITQAITGFLQRKGRHLRDGLGDLLRQLGISEEEVAQKISESVLKHPLIASAGGQLGTVIHREEFTRLLLDFASGEGAAKLEADGKTALLGMLQRNGVSDPAEALKNIHAMSLQLQASNPELANHVRDGLAVLHGASSQFVARVNSWFDQAIDRVSERFTKYTHAWVMAISTVVVLVVQLDIIAVFDRLSIDDQFRNTIVNSVAQKTTNEGLSDPKSYYDLLSKAGLVTLPVRDPAAPYSGITAWARAWSAAWARGLADPRKWPGMVIAILLLSLGAPFWYNALSQLLKLRSTLAAKDDVQRAQRQGSDSPPTAAVSNTAPELVPLLVRGESGDLAAVG